MIVGLVLVVTAVVVGAQVIGASNRTVAVWSIDRDLAEGTVLQADDLVQVDVNLGSVGPRYLTAATAPPVGRPVSRPLRAGELLAAADLGRAPEGRVVVVAVSPDRMPPGVTHGSVVDLYLTRGGQTPGDPAETELVQSAVSVQSVSAPSAGGLSAATSNRYQVAVLLPPDPADALIRTLPGGEPILALVQDAA
ncbi:SAF domain-containing protein [Nakamurella leprariae]|uniref:SAF domain-containing protein n=1 Tax=Nakamurella leprariae TaxID=2803911 RepID=A0A938Y8X3_9ACTN|nr:SAF domain-containing protein [Nakamurella leprariae]MBM9468211.1 SAF domain-containing protein [Nakamurella leprariae]